MTPVYVTATGQTDNLGDSLLRRGYLQALRAKGRLHVNLAGSNSDYISGLDLRPDDMVYDSARAWEVKLLRDLVRGRRPVLALNAGEARITATHAYLGLRMAILASLVRAAKGDFVQAGLGVREAPDVMHKGAISWALRRASVVTWRDPVSRTAVGIGSVQPDWAFALEPLSAPAHRDLISISMRGDRPMPGEHWFRIVRTTAEQSQARIVLVSQVRRDDERLSEIARRLGGDVDVVRWPAQQNHADRLDLVSEYYSRSHAVISDRLHALILGAIHGAVPVGLASGSAEKLRRTLSPAGLDRWCFDSSELPGLPELLIPPSPSVIALSEGARAETQRVADTIAARQPRVGRAR